MLRSLLSCYGKRTVIIVSNQKQSFLTNTYSCSDVWTSRFSSPILKKVNLEDFYASLDQNYTNKGVISAIDVDIYANSLKDASYLDELRDLIHKLRLSADTINTLASTHHAVVRNFIEHGDMQDLVNILRDPLNYGIFLDDFSANILLDKLLNLEDYEKAATVASQIMLQEDFSNEITCSLCQYACFKYILGYTPPEPKPLPESANKIEEKKIRIKFLRNPYFDDHFHITDNLVLSGKTLAWISEGKQDNLNKNLEILGWLVYKKYDKLLKCCELIATVPNLKVYKETVEFIQKESNKENIEQDSANILQKCLSRLSSLATIDDSLEEALKVNIENAINKRQTKDISEQQQLLKSWEEVRELQLMEQTKRLDRARRVQLIEEKQNQLLTKEQKLWFFDNEELIDLEIENKEEAQEEKSSEKKTMGKSDEDYIPPEIVPKRR